MQAQLTIKYAKTVPKFLFLIFYFVLYPMITETESLEAGKDLPSFDCRNFCVLNNF